MQNIKSSFFQVFTTKHDSFLDVDIIYASTSYAFLLHKVIPNQAELHEKRNSRQEVFCDMIEKGYQLPAITLGFLRDKSQPLETTSEIIKFIENNASDLVVIDGMKRLSSILQSANSNKLDLLTTVPVNIILADNMDTFVVQVSILGFGRKQINLQQKISRILDVCCNFGKNG